MEGKKKTGKNPNEVSKVTKANEIRAEFDEEGVYFYQAYNDEIADWAIENQSLGGPAFKTVRMTWIKPSFAWMLYRAGYGKKPNQSRILKIKLTHEAVGFLLSNCKCCFKEGGSNGRVQWDPERDLFMGENNEPRKMLATRSIQIGLRGPLSKYYVDNIISVEDVTVLAQKVGLSHSLKFHACVEAMKALLPELPRELPYEPMCTVDIKQRLGLVPV